MPKTIFIIITRSFITRNILRSGVLELLKKSGHKIIIIFPTADIPEYLKKEFEDQQVKLLGVKVSSNPAHRFFVKLKKFLLFNGNIKVKILYGRSKKNWKAYQTGFIPKKSNWLIFIQLNTVKLIDKIKTIKALYRFLDRIIFPERKPAIKDCFDKYKPDLVFSTSIISYLDIAFMKEAKRRKAKTVSVPKSWDNIPGEYYRFIPDHYMVPSGFLAGMAGKMQDIPNNKIHITGIPQFDWYKRKEIIKSREEHFKIKGLDPNKKMIFFGSAGSGAGSDYYIAELIYDWIKNNELAKSCQLFLRPHFTSVKDDIFKNLKDKRGVVIDKYKIIDTFSHSWDPSVEETIDFVNSVTHCDIMINVASTLSLDAACADRPIINPAFGAFFAGGKDVTLERNYGSAHYQWVLSTKATALVESEAELKKQINKYLLNPKLQAEERAMLREKLCYKVDGKSSQRLADVINNKILI